MPGSALVRTQCFCCGDPDSTLVGELRSCKLCDVTKKKKKKKRKKKIDGGHLK